MDWERIERDVASHTQALALGVAVGGSFRASAPSASRQWGASEEGGGGGGGGGGARSSSSGNSNNSSNSRISGIGASTNVSPPPPPSLALTALAPPPEQSPHTAAQLQALQKSISALTDSITGLSAAHYQHGERLDTLEHEQRLSMASASSAARERAELNIQSRTLQGRQQSLEEAFRAQDGQFASKESFAQLLDTTVEQVRALSVLSEGARQRSTQSLSLTEALIQALYELNSGPSGFRLDFLASLADGDSSSSQPSQPQVVRLLIDAMQQAIAVSVRNQFAPAIECMASLFRPQLDTLRQRIDEGLDEIPTRTASQVQALQVRVDRAAETAARLEQAVLESERGLLDCRGDVHKLREVQGVTSSSIQAVRESLLQQRGTVDELKATQNARLSRESEGAAARESLRAIISRVGALEEASHAARLDLDARIADMLKGQERLRGLDAEHARKIERLEGSLKADVGTVGLAQQALQQQFDVLTEGVRLRMAELERSWANGIGGGGGGGGGSGRAVQQAAERNEELAQAVANLALDLSDTRQAQDASAKAAAAQAQVVNSQLSELKALKAKLDDQLRAADDDFSRLAQRTGRSVAAIKEGMDALQSELVALGERCEATATGVVGLGKDVAALRANSIALTAPPSLTSAAVAAVAATAASGTSPARSPAARRASVSGGFAEPTQASTGKVVSFSYASTAASAVTNTTSATTVGASTKPKAGGVAGPAVSSVGPRKAAAPIAAGAKIGTKVVASPSASNPPAAVAASAKTSSTPKTKKTSMGGAKASGSSAAANVKTKSAASGAFAAVKDGEVGEFNLDSVSSEGEADSGSDFEASFQDDSDGEKPAPVAVVPGSAAKQQQQQGTSAAAAAAAAAAAVAAQADADDSDSFFDSDADEAAAGSEDSEDVIGRDVPSPEQLARNEQRRQALQRLVPLESTLSPTQSPAPRATASLSGSLAAGRTGSGGGGGGGSGGGNGGVSGIRGTVMGSKDPSPVYASSLVLGGGSVSALSGRDAVPSAASSANAAAETAAAARRTLEAAAALKRESVQCTHCLRRLPTADITTHVANCELRTERCPRGCGASVRFVKMEQHLAASCPKR